MKNSVEMLGLLLSVSVQERNESAFADIITSATLNLSDKEAAKQLFKPTLSVLTIEDREWIDKVRIQNIWA